MTYGSRVNRFLAILRRHGFDLVVVLLVVAAALELWVRPSFPDWPRSALWLDIAAVALLAAPLFLHRRFPFGALAAYWIYVLVWGRRAYDAGERGDLAAGDAGYTEIAA